MSTAAVGGGMLQGAREESEAGPEPEGERPVGEIVAREDQARRRFAMQCSMCPCKLM